MIQLSITKIIAMKKYLSALPIFFLLLFSLSSCSFEPEDVVPQETSLEQTNSPEKFDPPSEDLDPPIEEELNHAYYDHFDSKVPFTIENSDTPTIDPEEGEDEDLPNVLQGQVTNESSIKVKKTN